MAKKIYNCNCTWDEDTNLKMGTGYILVTECTACKASRQKAGQEGIDMDADMVRKHLIVKEANRIAEESLINKGELT